MERIRCRIEDCGQYIAPEDYRIHAHYAHRRPVVVCGACGASFWTEDAGRAHHRRHHPGRWRARYQQAILRVLLGRRRPERPAPEIERPTPRPAPPAVEEPSPNPPPVPMVCPACSFRAANARGLRAHQGLMHPGQFSKPVARDALPWACPECGEVFTTRHGVGQHQRQHRNQADHSRHVCPDCGRHCTTATVLRNHRRERHPLALMAEAQQSEEAVQCRRCGDIFPSQSALSHHARSCTFPELSEAELARHRELTEALADGAMLPMIDPGPPPPTEPPDPRRFDWSRQPDPRLRAIAQHAQRGGC